MKIWKPTLHASAWGCKWHGTCGFGRVVAASSPKVLDESADIAIAQGDAESSACWFHVRDVRRKLIDLKRVYNLAYHGAFTSEQNLALV